MPHFHLVPVDETLADRAADVSARYQIWGCDAVYIALARQLGATLITLDRQQQERVPPDLVARTPAEELAAMGW